jgi:hypothetical protein
VRGAANHLLVGGRQVGCDLVDQAVRVAPHQFDEWLQKRGQRLLGVAGRGELVQVELVHPVEEVEVRVV